MNRPLSYIAIAATTLMAATVDAASASRMQTPRSSPSSSPSIQVTGRSSAYFWEDIEHTKEYFMENLPAISVLTILILLPLVYFWHRYRAQADENRCLWFFTTAENAASALNREAMERAVGYYEKAYKYADPAYPSFSLQPSSYYEFLVRCLTRKARVLAELGKIAEAVETYKQAIKEYTKDCPSGLQSPQALATIYYQLGYVFRNSSSPAEASAAFAHAVRIDPSWEFVANIQEQKALEEFLKEQKAAKATPTKAQPASAKKADKAEKAEAPASASKGDKGDQGNKEDKKENKKEDKKEDKETEKSSEKANEPEKAADAVQTPKKSDSSSSDSEASATKAQAQSASSKKSKKKE